MKVAKIKCEKCGAVLRQATKEHELGAYKYKCPDCGAVYFNGYENYAEKANDDEYKAARECLGNEVSLRECENRLYQLWCEENEKYLLRFLREHLSVSGGGYYGDGYGIPASLTIKD